MGNLCSACCKLQRHLSGSHNLIPAASSRRSQAYEPLLLENEREAVADLLQYLESMSCIVFSSAAWLTLVAFRPNNYQLLFRISSHGFNDTLVL